MSNTAVYANSRQHLRWSRKTIHKRWNDVFRAGSTISLIERWPDENYSPLAIPVKQHNTQHDYIITAELPDYELTDVHVDVLRGCLIILATHHGDLGERYAEISLPTGINRRVAELEFRDGIFTASFRKTTLGLAALRLALAKFGL